MERPIRKVGDLINVMGTSHLGIILKIHEKAGNTRFYLVHDNVTNKEKWMHESTIFDPSAYNPNVELLGEL
jgi:hypothetical protein